MAIPDFQSIFLPYLKLLADGKPHATNEMEEQLAQYFHLTDDERKELLPSGKQARFRNRIAWTSAHLKQARLIEPVSRGTYKITERGISVLAENPAALNLHSLMRFPEFQEWRTKRNTGNETSTDAAQEQQVQDQSSAQTPEEILEATHQTLRNLLAKDLLEQVRSSSPLFFEQVVIDLLVAMGYGGSRAEAASLTKQSGDEGIDGLIKEDRLGLDTIYVQAKRWEAAVGRPVVQAFAGSLEGARARKGVLLTTSRFSADAKSYVDKIEKKIVLIDGERLADLMIEHNVGVSEAQSYVVKKINTDYFGEE